MKQFLKFFLIPFVGFLALMSPLVSMASETLEVSPVAVGVVLIGAAILAKLTSGHTSPTIHGADITVDIWVNYIIERLWKDNQFTQHAYNDDQHVIGGKIVHIPQPGAKPIVRKNRSQFPAAAVRRTDSDILYALDEYTTDPTHIQDAEKVELTYDKIDSVLGDHIGAISETVADDLIIKWLTGVGGKNNVIKTTGASTALTLVEDSTQLVKAATHDDVRKANLAMNVGNVPKTERFALIEENMADQIFQSLSENQYRGFTQYANAETGVLGRLYNFDIMTRSSVAVAGNGDVIKALGSEIVEGDKAVSMFWQKNAVARAMGEVKFFENLDDPQYYGDIYSSLLRMGGRRRRADDKGVIALIQDEA